MHSIVRAAAGSEFLKLQALLDEMGELKERDFKRYSKLKAAIENKILNAAEVICTTCVMAGNFMISKRRFSKVIIDEATQAVEAEALIPVTLGCKQLILVGDHMQLPPVVMSKVAAKKGLTRSLFERLVIVGVKPTLLKVRGRASQPLPVTSTPFLTPLCSLLVQYRMHPCIASFPSNMFYAGSLVNGVTAGDRTPSKEMFPWLDEDKPTMFWDCTSGMEEISSSGTSFLNRGEAAYVEKVVTHLLKAGASPTEIGVITPYDGQRQYCQDHLRRAGGFSQAEEIEVASVDAFQGREKDYIVISCVRTGGEGQQGASIGFLADPRRLNVAITRARLGLIIVGSARTLCRNILWGSLIVTMRDDGCLASGSSLTDLRENDMKIRQPRMTRGEIERGMYFMTALGRGGWQGNWDIKEKKGQKGQLRRHSQKDSRHDPRYNSNGPSDQPDDASMGFAPLPSFSGQYSYPDYDQRSLGGGSSNYPYTQGSATGSLSQADTSAYMAGGDFSQDTDGYSDYYYDSMSERSSSRGGGR